MGKPEIRQIGIKNVTFGSKVVVIEPVNLYCCQIDDEVFIGPFVEIQRGVTIGTKTIIHSHSFICELVAIGSQCTIAHGVMFINDTYKSGGPAMGDRSKWKSTQVGNRVTIGTNSTILPVNICNDVVIGAGSVVTRDITISGIYAGNPARLLRRCK